MNAIKQEDFLGCAVACVAFILKIKYKNARELFKGGEKKAQTLGFYCKEIVEVLNRAGHNYQYKYIKPKARSKVCKQGSIVFIKRSKKYIYGHYLVRSEKKWMDSWINLPDESIKAGFRKRLPGKAIYAVLQ